ncbi:MAG: hypothetical protein IJ849_03185 [Selenomonadaceae bacterium]|nr:hypothetical protein [Selenomonadaceae bacterium]
MAQFVEGGIVGKRFQSMGRVYKRNNHSQVADVLGYYPPGTQFTVVGVEDSSRDLDYNSIQVVELKEDESGRHIWIGLGSFAMLFEEI